MNPPAVLHVLAALGGGVDRHVRDIASAVSRPHLLWHVGERADVLEAPGQPRFHPLDRDAIERDPATLDAWLRAHGVGLVHLHSVGRAVRSRAEWLLEHLEVPLVMTLHDVMFLRPDAFAYEQPADDPAWIAEIASTVSRASAVLAPSEFIAATARRVFDIPVDVVPNGIAATADASRPAPAARPDFVARRPQRVVAILGAVGEHKGADLVRELARALEGSGIGLVLVGYLDQQIYPGWSADGGLYVHGPYHPDHAGALLRAYGAELVLVPNRVPESFSYALSEAWAAAVPVLAARRGALGERVARHGGGWLLDEAFDAAHVAGRIRSLLAEQGDAEMARVRSQLLIPDPERVPTLHSMAQSLEAYYRRYGGEASAQETAAPSIEKLLAPSLDASLFRAELAHLADLCDAGGESSRHARQFETEARAWIAKLEGDVATLQADVRREFAERTRLATELAQVEEAARVVQRMPGPLRRLLALVFRHARN